MALQFAFCSPNSNVYGPRGGSIVELRRKMSKWDCFSELTWHLDENGEGIIKRNGERFGDVLLCMSDA